MFETWPLDGWKTATPLSRANSKNSTHDYLLSDSETGQLMSTQKKILYRVTNKQGEIINLGETSRTLSDRMGEKFDNSEWKEYATENDLFVSVLQPTNKRNDVKEGEAVHLRNYKHRYGRLPIFNRKQESPRILPSEWKQGLRSLARSTNSDSLGIRNTTRGAKDVPNLRWYSILEKLPDDLIQKNQIPIDDVQVLSEEDGEILAFTPTDIYIFHKKLLRKMKFIMRIAYVRMYYDDDRTLCVRRDGKHHSVFNPYEGDNQTPWVIFLARVVELSLRTKWG